MRRLFEGKKGTKKGKGYDTDQDELEWMDLDDDEYEDEDDEYYESDEDDEDYEDEEYYEDDEYYESDEDYEDDEYYESDEDDEEDEDEEYYEDDEEDEDYEDDEYYEDDEDDEYYESDEDSVRGIGKVIYKLRNMSPVDHIVAITGAAVFILAAATGILYFNARNNQTQIETFAEVGAELEGITVIGESGLVAISDAQAVKLMAAEMEGQEEEQEQQEENADVKIEVAMNMTSIQKDLKIKFINKKTGKLISNVGFEVEIEKPSGGTYTMKDEDKDGIIYQTGMGAGRYKVKMTGPADDKAYSISSEAVAITIRDTIEYKKVDVSDEVKTEAQVNAAVEDTKVNETVEESVNTDTVEWVESTKTLIEGTGRSEDSYEKIDKSQIADPGQSASAAFRLLSAVEPTATPIQEPAAAPTQEPTAAPTQEPTAAPTQEPTALPTQAPTATPTALPTATAQPTATVAPPATPSAQPTATVTPTPTATPDVRNDKTSVLKTTSGETLWVKDSNGDFREAKYADYYTAGEFYRRVPKTTGEYRYTGWQVIDGVTFFFDKDGNKVTGEQVIQGARYNFNSDGSLNTGSGHMGIDVSKWNGNIDWNAVKNSGVSYVIIRCGYRGSTTGALIEDPMFRSNIQGASKAGIKVGVYFFTQAVNEVEAVEEASMVLGLIKGYNISYPVFLDVETSNGRADGISSSTRTAVCKAFCQTIQNSGYKAGIYANKTWLNSYMDAPSLAGYKIWLAQYAAAPTYNRTRYDMWQYSSKGSVAGIKGNVDMNISYMGY